MDEYTMATVSTARSHLPQNKKQNKKPPLPPPAMMLTSPIEKYPLLLIITKGGLGSGNAIQTRPTDQPAQLDRIRVAGERIRPRLSIHHVKRLHPIVLFHLFI
jgi:hypothetical protein